MDILKKMIFSNDKKPVLLHSDSRNDNSLSKRNKTNITNKIQLKPSYGNIKNYKMKLKKNIPISKMNISFCKKESSLSKDDNTKDSKLISYIDLGTKNKIKTYRNNKSNLSRDSKSKYSFKKNLVITNNITNNISNHITNIILTNNNSNYEKKNLNSLKKPNSTKGDNKNILINKNINDSNYANQNLQKKKRIIKKNILERINFNSNKTNAPLTSRNSKIIDKNKNLKANSITNKIYNHNFQNNKENKTKIILERNKNRINTFFKNYINTSSNLNINEKKYKSKKILIKHINKINHIELNNNQKKVKKNAIKLLKDCTYDSKSKNLIKFNPSYIYLEDSLLTNSIISSKNKKEYPKEKNTEKNDCYSCRNADNKKYLNNNINNKFIHIKNMHKQNKSKLNINVNYIKNLNQMRALFDNKITHKSFGDKSVNNISYVQPSIITNGNMKNNFKNINNTYIYSNSKSKSKQKKNSKNNYVKSNIAKYKNIYNNKELINNLYKNKTDRSFGNITYTNPNDDNDNINIINIVNNFNNKKHFYYNRSFIGNNAEILKTKTDQGEKRKISSNAYKNIKKYFLSKSLIKNCDISSPYINYKNDNYNSYKEQYLYNMAYSYRNINCLSKDKYSKNYTKPKKPKYYSNQKKIHNKKIIINKKKNRCKKDDLEFSEINIHKNDFVNLIYHKNNSLKKNILKRNVKNFQIYPKKIHTLSKFKIINKNNDINNIREIRETYNSIPINYLKNILNMNPIYSERLSPTYSIKNNLMKSYNQISIQKDRESKKNQSFQISKYHEFNIPNYNNSLDKKTKLKSEENLNTKEKYKNNKQNNKENKENNYSSQINNKETSKNIIKHDDKFKAKINKNIIKLKKDLINENLNKQEEKDQNNKEEKIIISENKNNPQYLSEYLYDILENFLLDESFYISKNYINPNYLLNNETELTPEIRTISINWLIMILYKVFKFKENTLFQTVQIIERFLSKKMLSVDKTELLILSSLILSSKHEEIDYVNMIEALQLSNDKFTREEVINMEYEILNELNFELIIPTMNDFYEIYCAILKMNDLDKNKGLFILNIILNDYFLIKFPNFIISLAVVKLVTKTDINFVIQKIRYYLIKNEEEKFLSMINEEKMLDKVCFKIKKIYKNYLNNKYKNVEAKFSDEKYCNVANLSSDIIDISEP